MKREEIDRCQIQEWYPLFRPYSFKTLIHELPQSFVSYILDDSGPFILPSSIYGDDALPNRLHSKQEDSLSPDDEVDSQVSGLLFPEVEADIKTSIAALGGAVFPKLNWSSPKDAAWISTTGTLKCISFAEIALLLHSSDSIVHDLCHPYDSCDVSSKSCSPPQKIFIALRRWHSSLHPEMEFRCFVRDRNLVGISQREMTTFYPTLVERRWDIESLIGDFFDENVRLVFESDNYVFDVYVTQNRRIKIMDFGPYGAFTMPLLFSWDELEENYNSMKLELRVVERFCGVRLGMKTAVPFDYMDTGPGSGWDRFLQRANEEVEIQKQNNGDEA